MPDHDEVFERIDALIGVGLRIARSAPSGRLVMARIADVIDPGWLPPPWDGAVTDELRSAQAGSREPISGKQVEAILKEAWDGKWSDELDSLELTPAAVTATSQVHRGQLDGRAVAVKILRPGLGASVRQDLALLEGLASPLKGAFPALDPGALLREVRTRVADEFDLEHEAGNQRRFQRALRGHDRIDVPAAVTRLANENVLVADWADGTPLGETSGATTDSACATLVTFVLGGLRAGFVHADTDPRDVLVRADGGITVLDFGAVAEPDADRVALVAAAVDAFIAEDEAAFADAVAALGALPRDLAGETLALAREVLGPFAGPDPVRLDAAALEAIRDRADAHRDRAAELIVRASIAPQDIGPLRAAAQLFLTIARVGATAPWRDLVQAALRDGWDA